MFSGVSAKSASYLGWLRPPLELIDLPLMSDRLTVHRVLEPFDHRFKVAEGVRPHSRDPAVRPGPGGGRASLVDAVPTGVVIVISACLGTSRFPLVDVRFEPDRDAT